MGLVEEVARSSGVDLVRAGSLDLVSFGDALKFLDAAADKDLLVLGIEGFRIVEGRVVPQMQAIADYSSNLHADEAADSIRDARHFILQVGEPGMLFDFELNNDKKSSEE